MGRETIVENETWHLGGEGDDSGGQDMESVGVGKWWDRTRYRISGGRETLAEDKIGYLCG